MLTLSVRPEDHFFDRKSAGISGQKLQKTVVAFTNAGGGEVVIGVADDKDEPDPSKRWSGLPTIEGFNSLLQAVHILNPSVNVRYEFLKNEALKSFALQIFVERSADVNKTDDGKV
ncbi:MAG: AlbA family DNA-binding domain-containing protein [Bradyrhizobium sp.]